MSEKQKWPGWDLADNRGLRVEGASNSINICIETWLELEGWKSTIEPSSDIVVAGAQFETSKDAAITALEMLIRDLAALTADAKKALKEVKKTESEFNEAKDSGVLGQRSGLRETLDQWGDAIQALPIRRTKGNKK